MKLPSCLLVLLLLATPAFAAAHLVRSSPANHARVKSPRHIVLHFSEALEPAFSGALLLDTEGRNLTGAPIRIDGTLMRLTPGKLPPGAYMVTWHAMGHEGRPTSGRIHFTVRK